ncbi:synaptosomal-associated protein 23 [Paramormyrops kingsleyae]|uniref:Synaptosomal-associated protein n=1 Tax=Paramormyrops kingsleyae TaxID=1676925 RepID=A0A3B3S7R3_9TELE|nr:synaptosomal-associated protein 23 isoform X1 [Paramormyrops kingsleyae]XP_023683258.1 synaptosomal-associated protein 23 isoform X1 [Paramormyrops kingsleyae]
MAEMTAEEITARANQVTDESLESTRRMLRLAEESRETGVNTVTMLDEQGEQLKSVEQGMDQINQDMHKAEKDLSDLSKCCGLCVCPWNRVASIEHDSRYRQTWGLGIDNAGGPNADAVDGGNPAVLSSQPPRIHNGMPTSAAPSGPYIKRITNDAREDEMEENLGQVGNIIDNLKSLAVDMGTEIDKQNKQIDRITDKAEINKARIDDANQRANKLIK